MTVRDRIQGAAKQPGRSKLGFALALAAAVIAPAESVRAGKTSAWIGSWTASPQPIWGSDFAFPTNIPPSLKNQTIRQVARVSLGGSRIRIVLSNEYGSRPLVIGEAHVGLAAGGAKVTEGSDRKLTFGGRTSVTVPPGAPVVSDPVDLAVTSLGSVAVSLFLPDETPLTTFHWDGRQTAFIANGNVTGSSEVASDTTTDTRVFLTGILVDAPAQAGSVVVLGDSITDGNGVTPDSDHRWPDFLAERLAPRNVAVLNAGISGGRMLSDRMGVNALARFERDVLSQPHVKTVIVLIGINDISWPGTAFAPNEPALPVEALIAGYRQLIARAGTHNVRIIGATLTPFEGALTGTPLEGFYNADKEKRRQQVNAWIRSSGEFDAFIDFDSLTRDPARPTRLRPDIDSGDHLHPGDRGNKIIADAIDLGMLF